MKTANYQLAVLEIHVYYLFITVVYVSSDVYYKMVVLAIWPTY